MPELPEVERGRRLAEAAAAGRRIARVWCGDDPLVFDGVAPDHWREALEGRRVEAARRWGKQLWFVLDTPPHPLFHFGMAGGFKTPASTPLQLKSGPKEDPAVWPPRFVKIRMRFDDGGELAMTDGRRLGRILLRDDPEGEPPVAKLGFDPLLAMPPPKRFCELIRARGANVKSLLLDQSFAAGVGNWIADEVLYQAGIDPRRRAPSADGRGSAPPARQARRDRQARRQRQRRRRALPPLLAVSPALGQARGREDDARRSYRAPDDRRPHDGLGAGRAAVTRALSFTCR